MDTMKVHDVRGEIQDDDESVYRMDHPDSNEEIPTLDMTSYLSGQPGGRGTVAAQLREISKTVGFFYLKGHGIPQDLIHRVFEESRRFHALADRYQKDDCLLQHWRLQIRLPAVF